MERTGGNRAQARLSCTWGEVATSAGTGGHAVASSLHGWPQKSSLKIMKEQQYYLKSTPEISIFIPSYPLNQLVLAQAVVIKVVDLRDISNFA